MKKVVLCGLGAVGVTYGAKLNGCTDIDLRIVVDKERLKRYQENKPYFNGEVQNFKYILPSEKFSDVDLIIITTKFQGLKDAILNIKNFAGNNTRIISLINGISSEQIIQEAIPQAKVLKSYFIGHSAMKSGNKITQDGIGKIVIEKDKILQEIFDCSNIKYELPDDIDYAMWRKFAFNTYVNQTSAVLNMTFGELKRSKYFTEIGKKVTGEICQIAEKRGIKHLENLEKDVLESLNEMCDEGKTSMLQDILAGRKTEVEIFGGEVLRLGKIYNILTPYNQLLYDLVKIKEGTF